MQRLLVLVVLFAVSCGNQVSSEDLKYLNGYWEIENVEFTNGNKKEYPMNTVVDYIEIKKLKGFRKKVVPRFDGTFETSDDAETFIIQEENGLYYLKYKNPLSEWEERLVSLTEDTFTLKNPDGITYHFRRFEPIKLD